MSKGVLFDPNNQQLPRVLAVIPGGGKTYVGEKYVNVVDLESAPFNWVDYVCTEETKAMGKRKKNPEYPRNYISEIVTQWFKDDSYICIVPVFSVIRALENIGIPVLTVGSTDDMLPVLQQRFKTRGNTDHFIRVVKERLPETNRIFKENHLHYILKDDETLEDLLLATNIPLVLNADFVQQSKQ